MSLSKFIQLNEGQMRNKAFLVFEAFIDNISDAHYKKENNSIVFNIGKTSQLSRFSNLDFIIRESGNSGFVKLGKRRTTSSFAIVVDVNELPPVHDLESFLDKKELIDKIVEEIERYMDISSKDNVDSNDSKNLTDYEKSKLFNTREKFEEVYQLIVAEVDKKLSELDKLVSNFKKQIEETGNPSRKATLELAIEKLQKDYIGSSYKDFTKMVFNLLDEVSPNFKEHLDKDNKKLLDARLKQFYHDIRN